MRTPVVARSLVSLFIRDGSAEFIVGDLDESYRRELEAGEQGARWRYWRMALASIWSRRDLDETGPAGGPPPRRNRPAIARDIRFAARVLRKNPGFTATAVLTLALGIGANTAVFSVLNGVMLRPLPYAAPNEIINVWQVFYEWQDSDVSVFRSLANRFPASYPVFRAWQERGQPFEGVAAYGNFQALLEGAELSEWVDAIAASDELFEVLGVEPIHGRGFVDGEDLADAERVVVLSHSLWMSRYAGDPGVLGEPLDLTGVPHTIVGVMPPGFYFPGRDAHVWVPLRERNRRDSWTSQSLSTVARLRDGVSIEQAQTEMDAITLQILEDNPDSPEVGIRLVSRVEQITGNVTQTLVILMGAVGLVLVVTTTNLAGLLLVRATSRRQEIAVRRALGASGGQLATQLLVEGFMLAAAGGALGLAVTALGMRFIKLLLPDSIPRIEDITVDFRVLLFTLGVSFVIALVFGLASAVHAIRGKLTDALRATSSGTLGAGGRARSALVVGEVTVAVVLMVGAALLLTSYVNLSGVDRGFDESEILTFSLSAPIEDWDDPVRLRTFYQRALQSIEELPAVAAVAAVESMPFSGSQSSGSFQINSPEEVEDGDPWSLENTVSPQFFDALRVPVVRGRTFTLADTADEAGVIVINQRLAEQYFEGDDPIGQIIFEEEEPFTIIGVVADIKHRRLDERIEPMRYRLQVQDPELSTSVVVRTVGDPLAAAPAIRRVAGAISPRATVSEVATLASRVADTTSLPRFRSISLAGLAAVATILAVLGVYGVVALGVAERRREIGVRMTLGAAQRDVLRQVLGGGGKLIIGGVVLGIVAARLAVRWLEAYVFDVPVTDPWTFAGVALVVAAVALLATWIPARRASRIEPLTVLRGE